MGDSLSDEDRDFILISLSDLFAGIEPDDDGMKRLCKYPINEIKRIYFHEVAIACAHNLIITTPEMGGFDQKWLKDEISRIQSKRESSIFGKAKFELGRIFWGLCSLKAWRDLEKKLKNNQDAR